MGYFDDAIDKKEEYLEHHGIRGQKWGIRRFQNADGTLTAQGRSRYGDKADKVEKKLQGATKWENKAINAKTGIGRSLATTVAANKRYKADVAADRATGNYKMLHINRDMSRAYGATAETNARVAQGLKDKAGKATGKEKEKLINNAIKHLSTAENAELGAKAYKNIADAPVLSKAKTYINEQFKALGSDIYTSAGRKTSGGDRYFESIGNAVLDGCMINTVTRVRDAAYKKGTTAEERWNKIANR